MFSSIEERRFCACGLFLVDVWLYGGVVVQKKTDTSDTARQSKTDIAGTGRSVKAKLMLKSCVPTPVLIIQLVTVGGWNCQFGRIL
jgi:hypothetical protein